MRALELIRKLFRRLRPKRSKKAPCVKVQLEEWERLTGELEESQRIIADLQASIKRFKEREQTAALQTENWLEDRERMDEHVARLETSLALGRSKWEQEGRSDFHKLWIFCRSVLSSWVRWSSKIL